MMNEISKESAFLVTNASGRHINLLNDNDNQQQQQQPNLFTAPSPPSSEVSDETNNSNNDTPLSGSSSSKRKYHCTEPGCTKSFTTSGHLARHNRIHTGEKNFPCLFPGCQSRFSRQDNMMQHYRTHMSPKSRRTQKKVISEDLHPRPKLHAHQRIRSDPYRVERPLTIDQHLNNYKRSLLSNSTTLSSISSTSLSPSSSSASTSVKYNMPTPLGSVAASHMQRHQQKNNNNASSSNEGSVLNANGTWSIAPISHQASEQYDDNDNNMEEDDEEEEEQTQQQQAVEYDSTATGLPNNNSNTLKSDITFYQHKPLTFNTSVSFLPFTLLHPTRVILPTTQLPSQSHYQLYQQQQQEMNNSIIPPPPLLSSSSTSSTSINTTTNTTTENNTSSPSSSQAGLLQLAHIVSTFG